SKDVSFLTNLVRLESVSFKACKFYFSSLTKIHRLAACDILTCSSRGKGLLSWTKNVFTSQGSLLSSMMQVLVLDGCDYAWARCKMCCDATWQPILRNDSRIILLCDMLLYNYSRCTFQTYQSIKYYFLTIFCVLYFDVHMLYLRIKASFFFIL
ncbi:hypothetical protein DVH24_000562, partial [Malus domestica]